MKPYELLTLVLNKIEYNLTDKLDIDELATYVSLSSVHLQRIFKFAFGLPIAGYIRSRRLSASLESLLKTSSNVLDIAYEYGFEFEQSYIRAFKREYGLTPGELRKTGQIVQVTPPLQLFDSNRLSDGVFFGPQIVMVPQFYVVGRRHLIPFRDSVELPPKVAKDFWQNDRGLINNTVNPNVYFGLTRIPAGDIDYSYYLTSVRVKELKNIPYGLEGDSFPASLCARFHYIGPHHYYDISADIARGMYNSIVAFANDKNAKYDSFHNRLFFEKIDTASYDGTYCQMEWFTPVFEKKNK
ncbi:MAG TPA: helix-turn-helix domain-containing protein [Clostridia bacterium]|nr:helix-turn-helix domain-containing protein [Clostridia bacterium]